MRRDWVIILSITFVVFIAWVVSDIYHARPGVQITAKLQEALEPLDPNFDQAMLDLIDKTISTQE